MFDAGNKKKKLNVFLLVSYFKPRADIICHINLGLIKKNYSSKKTFTTLLRSLFVKFLSIFPPNYNYKVLFCPYIRANFSKMAKNGQISVVLSIYTVSL